MNFLRWCWHSILGGRPQRMSAKIQSLYKHGKHREALEMIDDWMRLYG